MTARKRDAKIEPAPETNAETTTAPAVQTEADRVPTAQPAAGGFTFKTFVGVVALLVCAGILCFAFYKGVLTQEQRAIASACMATFIAMAAMQFTGTLEVKLNPAVEFLGGAAVFATGAFGTWFLTPWLFPMPIGMNVNVQLLAPGGAVVNNFKLTYDRPGVDSNSVEGTDSKVTLSDVPSGTEELVVLSFVRDGYAIDATPDAEGTYRFKINDDGSVKIKLKAKYKPGKEPTKEQVIQEIESAGLTEADINAATFTTADKEKATITIDGESGNGVALWAYDCWFCYNNGKKSDASRWMDIARFRDTESGKQAFSMFDRHKSTSGYFALFIEYIDGGESKMQCLGVYNIFAPPEQEVVIRGTMVGNDPEKLFEASFTHLEKGVVE